MLLQLICILHLCSSAVIIKYHADEQAIDNFQEIQIDDHTFYVDNFLNSSDSNPNVLESMYAHQSVGKSHRFYYTLGERKSSEFIFS